MDVLEEQLKCWQMDYDEAKLKIEECTKAIAEKRARFNIFISESHSNMTDEGLMYVNDAYAESIQKMEDEILICSSDLLFISKRHRKVYDEIGNLRVKIYGF